MLANPLLHGGVCRKPGVCLIALSRNLVSLSPTNLEEGSAMNSTLKVPAPEIRTLIEKIKVDLRKRAEKKAKLMLLKRPKRH